MQTITTKDGRFTARQHTDSWSVKHNATNAYIGYYKNKEFSSGLWSYTMQDLLVLHDLILEIEKRAVVAS